MSTFPNISPSSLFDATLRIFALPRIALGFSILQGNGVWYVILTIENVQKSDTEGNYILEARNNEGAYEYMIQLSTSAEPAGEYLSE